MKSFVYGTPSAEESNSLWAYNRSSEAITGNAYEEACVSLEQHLEKKYDLGSEDRLGSCYVRGDFYGDRTQYLEIYDAQILNAELLQYIQEWLNNYESGQWRVVIPTYSEDAAIMVYVSCVRFSKELELISPDAALRHIRNQLDE